MIYTILLSVVAPGEEKYLNKAIILFVSAIFLVSCQQSEKTKAQEDNVIKAPGVISKEPSPEQHGNQFHDQSGLTKISVDNTLRFNIVERKDISFLNTPRMVYRVVVDVNNIPTKEQLKNIAIAIWEDGNKKWQEFTIFLYLTGMDYQGFAYGIAEFKPTGLFKFDIIDSALLDTKWDKTKPTTPSDKIIADNATENASLDGVLKYKIVERKDTGYSSGLKMVYKVVIDGKNIPTKEQLKNSAISIWEDGNKKWLEFTVLFYLAEMNIQGEAHAKVELNPTGFISYLKYETPIKHKNIENKYPVPQEFGLSLKTRKEIYYSYTTQLGKYFDDPIFDDMARAIAWEIMSKYNITQKYLLSIIAEGTKNYW